MRPSPPFVPSGFKGKMRLSGIRLTDALPSFGESTDQMGGLDVPKQKRYSSSFSHRYTAMARLAGSEGYVGSGEKNPSALSGRVGLCRERRESERDAVSACLELLLFYSPSRVLRKLTIAFHSSFADCVKFQR